MRTSTPSPRPVERRFLDRPEIAILAGMLATVCSVPLVWSRVRIPNPFPGSAALVGPSGGTTLLSYTGMHPPVQQVLTVMSVVCGGSIIWAPMPETRKPLAALQALCVVLCLAVVLTHMAAEPGPVTALIGVVLMAFGATHIYYRTGEPPA